MATVTATTTTKTVPIPSDAPLPHASLGRSVYPLPYDNEECLRLRKQGDAIVAMMHHQPIHIPLGGFNPQKIVDVGCGINADMTIYLARLFPNAQIYGVDLAPIVLPEGYCPPNVTFIQGNILHLRNTDPRLAPGTVDLLYSRLLAGGMQDWSQYVHAVTDLLRPGVGWVEMQDFSDWHFYMEGEGSQPVSRGWKWVEYGHEAVAKKMKLDWGTFDHVDQIMQRAGLEQTKKDMFQMTWDPTPADPDLQLFASQGRAMWQKATTYLMNKLVAGESAERQRELLDDLEATLTPRKGLYLPFYAAYGRRAIL